MNNITWQQFELCNSDKTTSFENLCRLLFNRMFFNNSAILHSNPNNPGVEIEPIYNDISKKYISFQAKYFDKLSYSQIKHSIKTAIEHYKNALDVIYLYCNKDLDKCSKSYRDIEMMLKNNNIELVVVSNQEILNRVNDYPILISRFFGGITLSKNWFEEKLRDSIESLGQRHNSFNIETQTEEYFNLFVQNNNALKYINEKKNNLVERISNFKYAEYNNLLNRLENEIKNLPEITVNNIYDFLTYPDKINDLFQNEFNEIEILINKKENDLRNEEISIKDKNKIFDEIRKLRDILAFPSELSLLTIEEELIKKRYLIIKGDAGTGKTQLLSNIADEIISNNGYAVLLLGQNFISNEPIKKQILSILDLNVTFDDFLNYLEGLGEENDRFVYVFIDALNESTVRNIWKTNLNSLINTLDSFPHIKLALSVRSGYDAFVFDDAINLKIKNDSVPVLVHNGFFDKSVDAIKEFLDHYNIPFTPSYAVSYEMTNPLFLKLFCDTYDGEDVEMFSLFEKVIHKTNNELNDMNDLGTDNILINLLNQIVDYQLTTNKRITKEKLLTLQFWDTYGLNFIKLKYLDSLSKSNLLNTFAKDGTEYYYFGYNLLDDFLTAKVIMKKYESKNELKNYIIEDLLEIKENIISKHGNVGAFIVICSLYYEKYKEELFPLIIDQIKDDYSKRSIVEEYIESFQWRKSTSINEHIFLDFINKYKVSRQTVFSVLFQNATKINNPLNAEFLHSLLFNKTIAHRDHLWTTYINSNIDEDSRIFQLIQLFEKGNASICFENESIMLILTIFSWILTSSNRFLRDKTSKTIIEILKSNFNLCIKVLNKFENVNDPYIIQRLYGIVFGVCTRSQSIDKNDYLELVNYVYYSIFDKELVYPDILLRDYAKSIIQFYVHNFTADDLNFNVEKIYPPYNSDDIPVVEKQNYKDDYGSGFNRINSSMQISSLNHWYGDFGRYVFESALNDFKDVDVENAYYYAMQFIRDELGYTDEIFNNYDCNSYNSYSRSDTKKIERIGKKYQWIAMYNILARISDNHLLNDYEGEYRKYKGAWEPYVRDFDPTINHHYLKSNSLPKFDFSNFDKEALFIESEDENEIKEWASNKVDFFVKNNDNLILKDNTGTEWVLLHQNTTLYNKRYEDNHRESLLSNGNQRLWKMSMGYFVEEDVFDAFMKNFNDSNFDGRWFPEIRETYQMFCREFAWSDSFEDVFCDGKVDVYINSDEFEIEKIEEPLIKEDGDNIFFEFIESEYKINKEIFIGQAIQSYLVYLWECEYDASNENAISLFMPCKEIIDCFKLTQKQYDGCFYDGDNLVVFDGSMSGVDNGLLMRKDYLEHFLKTKHLKLFWTCLGEKQYFKGHYSQIWSEWSGFLYMGDNGIINGQMKCKEVKKSLN